MKRKTFIYNTGMVGLAVLLQPSLIFAQSHHFSAKELTGVVRPELFGKGFNLRKEAAEAFTKMMNAARKEGIKMYSVSSYRSFDHQNRIWEKKYNRYKNQGLNDQQVFDKIVEYSTIPGTSRHHWGTDLDIIDLNRPTPSDPLLADHFENGIYNQLHQWLVQHASEYGFYQAYTNVEERKGFAYEPWHYSYKPLAVPMLKAMNALDLKNVLANLPVKGSDKFTKSFINRYIDKNINDINPVLLSE